MISSIVAKPSVAPRAACATSRRAVVVRANPRQVRREFAVVVPSHRPLGPPGRGELAAALRRSVVEFPRLSRRETSRVERQLVTFGSARAARSRRGRDTRASVNGRAGTSRPFPRASRRAFSGLLNLCVSPVARRGGATCSRDANASFAAPVPCARSWGPRPRHDLRLWIGLRAIGAVFAPILRVGVSLVSGRGVRCARSRASRPRAPIEDGAFVASMAARGL